MATAKNVVLVHGAFADGSGWEGVYRELKQKGHNVSVVGNPNTGLADEIKGSHLVFISQPKAVADVIDTAAKGAK